MSSNETHRGRSDVVFFAVFFIEKPILSSFSSVSSAYGPDI